MNVAYETKDQEDEHSCFSDNTNADVRNNAQGIRMKRFRMEHIAADRIEGEMTYDMKVVAKDMGMFIKNAVSA